MDGSDLAGRDQGHRIINAGTGVLGEADEDARVPELGAQLRKARLDLPAETAMKEQILGGVA